MAVFVNQTAINCQSHSDIMKKEVKQNLNIKTNVIRRMT